MLDVAKRFVERQRPERVAHADSLAQRRVCRPVEAPVELRLSDQQHRQQVLIVELKIRQQADFADEHGQLLLVDGVLQPGESFLVLRAFVEEARIGRLAEWFCGEAKEFFKHRNSKFHAKARRSRALPPNDSMSEATSTTRTIS